MSTREAHSSHCSWPPNAAVMASVNFSLSASPLAHANKTSFTDRKGPERTWRHDEMSTTGTAAVRRCVWMHGGEEACSLRCM